MKEEAEEETMKDGLDPTPEEEEWWREEEEDLQRDEGSCFICSALETGSDVTG